MVKQLIAVSTNEAKRDLLVSPCKITTSASAPMSRGQRTKPIGEGGTTKHTKNTKGEETAQARGAERPGG